MTNQLFFLCMFVVKKTTVDSGCSRDDDDGVSKYQDLAIHQTSNNLLR